MNKKELLIFLSKAHRNTYAAPKEIKSKFKVDPILPSHKDYDFVEGNWRYHDSYAGISWAPGREVVFFNNSPVWCMSYQGQTVGNLTTEFIEQIFEFLKKALRAFKEDFPFRGLDGFAKGNYKYSFKIKGDYSYFTGRESVTYKGKEVFFQDVMGSLIK